MTFSKALVATASAAFFSGLLSFASGPAFATPMTDAFIANVGANVGFLTESSRLIEERSQVAAVRSYATDEMAEQTLVASALVRLGPALAMSGSGDEVATGRSVAVEGHTDAPAAVPLQAANGRVALGRADLDQLKAASGQTLVDLYWQKQLDALSQLEADYRAYIKDGDDLALVALAKADLPRVMRRIEALTLI